MTRRRRFRCPRCEVTLTVIDARTTPTCTCRDRYGRRAVEMVEDTGGPNE